MAFKKYSKSDVVDKVSFSRSDKKNGQARKSGTVVTFKDGSTKTLLTPSGKGEKFAEELRTNIRKTNGGTIKRDEYAMPMELTNEQRAYRSGYLEAQKDSARIYSAKKRGKK